MLSKRQNTSAGYLENSLILSATPYAVKSGGRSCQFLSTLLKDLGDSHQKRKLIF